MPAGTGVDTIIVSARKFTMGALEQRLFIGSLFFPTGRFASHLPFRKRLFHLFFAPKSLRTGEHSPLLIVLNSIASILFAAVLAACRAAFPLIFQSLCFSSSLLENRITDNEYY